MIRGNELEDKVFENDHINTVLNEMGKGFARYFQTFKLEPINRLFQEYILKHQSELSAYEEYLNIDILNEFEYDPNAFKGHTKSRCPIIQRCLWSQDEVMKVYKRSFNESSGRELLDAVKKISQFGKKYVDEFDDELHEDAAYPPDLKLEMLNEPEYGSHGVIGYGIQSTLLHGLYPREFAHRSQNSVWSLYFLSNRKDFGLEDGSEFLMIQVEKNTIEQNFHYPAQLFGFYQLQVYLMLKYACEDLNITFDNTYRYIYLDAFNDHVAEQHRNDINTYRRSSEDVEAQPWF